MCLFLFKKNNPLQEIDDHKSNEAIKILTDMAIKGYDLADILGIYYWHDYYDGNDKKRLRGRKLLDRLF